MLSPERRTLPTGRYALLATLLFLILPMISATRAFSEERALTLSEAYDLAFRNHEAIGIAGEGVVQARATLDKAVSRILPNLTVEGSHTRYTESKTSGTFVTQPDSSSLAEVRLTQPLYSGGREWATQRQARLNIQRSREGLEGARETVMLDTARAFYGVLKAKRDVEIKSAALKRALERSKVASARFRVGEVTKSAVLRAEAEAAGAEAELTRAKNGLDNAVDLLRRVTGLEGSFEAVEPPVEGPVGGDAEALVGTAIERRSDYRQSLLEERAAGEGITVAWAGFKPSLKAEGLYSWRDQEPQTTFFQEESTSGTLRLTYPLFEGGLRVAELNEAKSRLKEAELKRLGLKRNVEVQVREALNAVKAVEALIDSYKKQVAFAEEDYSMVFEQFKFGVATTLDVIDADTTLTSAQSSLSNATYDLELSKLGLKYVTGTLIDEGGQSR